MVQISRPTPVTKSNMYSSWLVCITHKLIHTHTHTLTHADFHPVDMYSSWLVYITHKLTHTHTHTLTHADFHPVDMYSLWLVYITHKHTHTHTHTHLRTLTFENFIQWIFRAFMWTMSTLINPAGTSHMRRCVAVSCSVLQ